MSKRIVSQWMKIAGPFRLSEEVLRKAECSHKSQTLLGKSWYCKDCGRKA